MNISYKIIGHENSIIFIHGLGLDKTNMKYFYEPLFAKEKQIKRIYIDLPGMGDSQGYSVNNFDEVCDIIAQFILEQTGVKKVSMVGHSYGGYLCLGAIYKYRLNVDKMFLTCPVVVAEPKKRSLEIKKTIYQEKFKPCKNKNYFSDFEDMDVIINRKTWKDYQTTIIPGIKKFNQELWNGIIQNNYSLSYETEIFQTIDFLRGYLLLGQFDNVVGSKDQERKLQNKIENIHILKNAGHNIMIDQKQEVLDYFEKFIYL